jgi:hypothetical protein
VRRRAGVASVIGTLFFMLVFMLALGSMAYVSGLQAQASQAQLQAESVAGQKAAEQVDLAGGSAGLMAENRGASSVVVNHLILSYPNGTANPLQVSADIPSGGIAGVAPLVPSGICPPGGSTCLSRYESIVSGNSPGSGVGLLTSLGNTFWYYPGSDPTSGAKAYFEDSTVSTSSGTLVPVPGLSFAGSAGGLYTLSIELGYYQSLGSSNIVYFGISAPGGATFLACADISGSTNPYQPSCASVSGTQLPQPTCFTESTSPACSYRLTVFVAFGAAPGEFQLEFKSNGAVTAFVTRGSYMLVSQLS